MLAANSITSTSSSVRTHNSQISNSKASSKSSPDSLAVFQRESVENVKPNASTTSAASGPDVDKHLSALPVSKSSKSDDAYVKLAPNLVVTPDSMELNTKELTHTAKSTDASNTLTPPWVIQPLSDFTDIPASSRLLTPPTEGPTAGVGTLKAASTIFNGSPNLWVLSSGVQNKKRSAQDAGVDSIPSQSKRVKAIDSRVFAPLGQKRPPFNVSSSETSVPSGLEKSDPVGSSDSSNGSRKNAINYAVGLGTPTLPKESLVVKLKFNRGHAKTVSAILKLKSKAASKHVQAENPSITRAKVEGPNLVKPVNMPHEDHDTPVRAGSKIARKTPSKEAPVLTPQSSRDIDDSPSHRPEKRSRESDALAQGPATKRLKLYDSGPIAQAAPSKSMTKEDVSTPRKDLKNSTARTISGGTKVSPPKKIGDTPRSIESSYGNGAITRASPGALKSSKSPQAWTEESTKLQNLGKTLKRQAASTYESLKGAKSKDDTTRLSKLYALERTESVLCFILSFSAIPYTQSPNANWIGNWRSLIPMAAENIHASRDCRELSGLCALLIAVCYTNITNVYAELKRCNVTCTEDATLQLRNMLQDLQNAQKHGADVERQLSRKIIAEKYRMTNKLYETLPIGLGVKPVAAVKLALVFMKEWASQEKLQWKQHLEQNVCAQFDT